MNLFRHEFSTLLRQNASLVVMWCGIVFIHLGYESQWWWEGPVYETESTSWSDTLHTVFSSLVSILVATIPVLAAASAFAAISPYRTGSVELLRPMSRRSRILVRAALLAAAIGIPLWIQEAVYLGAEAKAPVNFILLAIVLKIIITFAIWFASGALGWATGSVWKVSSAVVIGLLTILALDYIGERFPEFARSNPTADELALPPTRSYSSVGFVASSLTVGVIALLTARLIQSKLGFVAIAVAATFFLQWTQTLATLGAQHAVISFAARELPSSVRIDEGRSGSVFYTRSEEEREVVWNLDPHWSGMEENEIPWSHGSGMVTFRGGEKESLEFKPVPTFSGFLYWAWHVKEVRHGIAFFPDFTVFGATEDFGPISMSPTDSDRPTSMVHQLEEHQALPEDLSLDAEAKIVSAIGKIGRPAFLALDGSVGNLATLGRSWVSKVTFPESGGVEIRLRFYDQNGLPGLDFAPQPRRLFGLVNRSRKELILTGHGHSPSHIGGVSTIMPLKEITLTFAQSRLPSAAYGHDYLANAELVLIEVPFQGSTTQTVSLPDAGFWSRVRQSSDYVADWSSPPLPEPTALRNPQSTPSEIREAVYRIARQPPAYDAMPIEVSPAHREL
ncbi:MAG: hypothetical protein AAGC68_06840, partial [Verrucomicrobiota bacterium]